MILTEPRYVILLKWGGLQKLTERRSAICCYMELSRRFRRE